MANTRDTMGEQACLDALIAGTITEFEDDEVYELRASALREQRALTSVKLPACTRAVDYAFYNCTSLTSVELPVCARVGANAFYNCTSLTSVELPVCTRVGIYAFYNCTSLTSVTLDYDGVVTLGLNAIPTQFNSGGTGTIYVPASQLAAYQSSSSWSGYNLAAITE